MKDDLNISDDLEKIKTEEHQEIDDSETDVFDDVNISNNLYDEQLLDILEKNILDIFRESETLSFLENALDKPELLSVEIFEKEYEIQSDKPNLVYFLANKINTEAQKLKEINPYFNQGQFNWAVQTAFQLCVKHYHEEKKYNFMIIQVEENLDCLINKISKNLEKIS